MKLYHNATNKWKVQQLSIKGGNRLIALGGPNILNYVQRMNILGFNDITSFERNKAVYQMQLAQNPKCTLLFGSILSNLNEDAFYDLDFCNTITTLECWLPEIVNIPKYSITFSLRGTGIQETIRIFKKYGEAFYISYKDTSPMVTFFNNN